MNRNVLMCDVKYYIFQWLKDEKGKHENGVDLSTLFLLNNKELRKREIVNKYKARVDSQTCIFILHVEVLEIMNHRYD